MTNTIRRLTLILSGIGLSLASANALSQSSGIVAPTYVPGIAGHIVEGPITPVCSVNQPCTQPMAKAVLQMLDKSSGKLIGQAISNASGNFIDTVPAGSYVVHVSLPATPIALRCPDTDIVVTSSAFTFVNIVCDTGIR
ncbi:MAG TPA: hypothetical protein VFW00_12805 [Rhodocyclaceae bacterium]|nr:hypothetical protein [Rhodocyclaceae bacterium]